MAGRHYVEHGADAVDVVRQTASESEIHSEFLWQDGEPAPDEAAARRNAARAAGWRAERINRVFRGPNDTPDVSWIINQATGALYAPGPTDRDDGAGQSNAGWFVDPIVDRERPGLAAFTLSSVLPSLGRRPGVVHLAACEHVIDRPIYLYPGQTLRGAGVSFGEDGQVMGGTIIRLRGPDAQVVAIRRDTEVGYRYGCDLGELTEEMIFEGAALPEGVDREDINPDDYSRYGRLVCYHLNFKGAGRDGRGAPPNTPVVVENLAIVDERGVDDCSDGGRVCSRLADVTPDPGFSDSARPALDLVGAQFFQVKRCAFEQRRQRGVTDPKRVAIRAYLLNPDTSPYFQRVEGCTFRGWDRAIAYGPDSNTFVVRNCRFSIPRGGAGLATDATAVRVESCRFEGGPQSVGLELSSTRLTHLRNNVFVGLGAPVLMGLNFVERGLAAGAVGNLVIPPTGQSPVLARHRDTQDRLPFGGDLVRVPQFRTRVVFAQDEVPDVVQTNASLIARNLVANPEFRGFRGARWANRAVSNGIDAESIAQIGAGGDCEPWFVAARSVFRGHRSPDSGALRVAVSPEVEGGPLGRGLAKPIRIRLLESLPDTEMMIWQFICPRFRGGGRAYVHAQRVRQIANQPLSYSAWVRTNIGVRSGIDPDRCGAGACLTSGVSLALWTQHEFDYTDVDHPGFGGAFHSRSGMHSGGNRWELLAGAGFIPASAVGSLDLNRRRDFALRFGISVLRDDCPTCDGAPPYVEISTPFLSTTMHPQPPRVAYLTEDAGCISGEFHPHTGNASNIPLHLLGKKTTRAVTIAPTDWRVLAVDVAADELSNAGLVAIVDLDRGTTIASFPVGAESRRAVSLPVHMPNVPVGTRLALRVGNPRDGHLVTATLHVIPQHEMAPY